MNRNPVSSSQIVSVGHDPETNTIEVEFNSGAVWQYAGVDAAKHAAFVGAESLGRHFGKHIKPHHAATKVSG